MSYQTETIVQPDGRLTLQHLPFSPGQRVAVVVSETNAPVAPQFSLRGKPLRYDRPTEPVAEGDWEAGR